MRFLLTILLILSFGYSDGQQVINAHVRYRGFVSVSNDLLLDLYPGAAAAYSLRKLDKDYSGSAIRVRKDTTGQPEQDIGFLPSGELDTVSLKSFLNQRSGFVVTWYNQADSSGVFGVRNATNTSAGQQPGIAANGVIFRAQGKPSIRWTNGVAQRLNASFAAVSQPITVAATAQLSAASGINASVLYDANIANIAFLFYSKGTTEATNNVWRMSSNTGTDIGSVNANFNLIYGLYNGASSAYAFNGASATTINAGTNSLTGLRIGNIRPGVVQEGVYDWSGWISELVFWPSNQSSNKSGIESNINSFYAIY